MKRFAYRTDSSGAEIISFVGDEGGLVDVLIVSVPNRPHKTIGETIVDCLDASWTRERLALSGGTLALVKDGEIQE